MNGCDGLRTLTFYVRDASKSLPYLNLVCKRPQEKENIGEIMVTLYSDEQIEDPPSNVISSFFSDEGGEKEIFVDTNSYVELHLQSNPSTGYSWTLMNEDEFKTSETLSFIGTEYESSCPELIDGCGGVDKYIFFVKDAYGELPKIKLVYKRAWENKSLAETLVTLKPIVYPDQPTRLEFPISFDINGGKEVLLVQRDSIVRVNLESNPSTGYSWILVNEDEINNSEVLEYQDSSFKSNCGPEVDGCGGIETFSFLVKNTKKELPRIHLVYKRPWEKENIVAEVVVILQSNESIPNPVVKQKEFIASFDYNGGEKELIVETGAKVIIELKSNPTTGNSWTLVNVDEINNSEVLEYQDSIYESQCQPNMMGCGGIEYFYFLVKDATKELPCINLVYKRSWEKESYSEVIVTLRSDELLPFQKKIFSASFDIEGGEKELLVEYDSIVKINALSNPSTGYTWILENEPEFKQFEGMEYQDSSFNNNFCKPGIDGCGGTQTFSFYIGTPMSELPKINLVYKRPWEEEIYSKIIVTLKHVKEPFSTKLIEEPTELIEEPTTTELTKEPTSTSKQTEEPTVTSKQAEESSTTYPFGNENGEPTPEPTPEPTQEPIQEPTQVPTQEPTQEPTESKEFTLSYDYTGGKEELLVESDSIVKLELKTNPSTGYSWTLVNEKEIKESENISLLDDTYRSTCVNRKMKGCGGIRTLTFYIKKAINDLPKIKLVYKRSQDKIYLGEVEVTLKLNETTPETKKITKKLVTSNNIGAKEISSVIIEDNNTLLTIEISDDTSLGYSWFLGNKEDLKHYSHLVELKDSTVEMNCNDNGCSSKIFQFLVKNANKQLPKLDFVYAVSEGEFVQMEFIVNLKGASVDDSQCLVDDYPCCIKAKPIVISTDSLGNWGAENSNWCFIKETDYQCFSERLGYPCCSPENTEIVLTDIDGHWGVENNNWCGIN